MQILTKTYISISLAYSGYIAGVGDGIVTVAGLPASRKISLLDAQTLIVITEQWALKNGRYMFLGLNPDREHLVMVRDYKREFEPFAWDYVKPANDLSIDEQRALWQTWQ